MKSMSERFEADVAAHAERALGMHVLVCDGPSGRYFRVMHEGKALDIPHADSGYEHHERAARDMLPAARPDYGSAERAAWDITWDRCVASTATTCIIMRVHKKAG